MHRFWKTAILLLAWTSLGGTAPLAGEILPTLTSAREVRQLTPTLAGMHFPVSLEGVVTYHDPRAGLLFVQDETMGIKVLTQGLTVEPGKRASFRPGARVRVEGVTGPGDFVPLVARAQVEVLGPGVLPTTRRLTFKQVVAASEDSQFVAIEGVVRSVTEERESGLKILDVALEGGRLNVYVPGTNVPTRALVDSVVRVNAVRNSLPTKRRQLFDVSLLCPGVRSIKVLHAPPEEPFNVRALPINHLLQYGSDERPGHRVKVAGTITHHQPGRMFLRDATQAIEVHTPEGDVLKAGDQVEVLGFPAVGKYSPILQDAEFRLLRRGMPPHPVAITAEDARAGEHDANLVSVEARVLERSWRKRETVLVCESDGVIFNAHINVPASVQFIPELVSNCRVRLTGICLVEGGSQQRPEAFSLILRRPGDVSILDHAPWWNLRRLLVVLGILVVAIVGVLAWVAVLQRRVQQQTRIIREKLQQEKAIKERYLDLFENANDMVYTHDLTGRFTSVNKVAEELTGFTRADLLQRGILDLISPSQAEAAAVWLQRVIRGECPPHAEWEILSSSGERVLLEISTRLIDREGKRVECEGVARDITERKRLEREILDISGREQRRIGHDLHDGLSQHLAGVAFLTEVLQDRLSEDNRPEAADAEKIARLLNEALRQTKGMARGLFPVRLEENGLASALEELAANTEAVFRVQCRLTTDAGVLIRDPNLAEHLYYIAKEAISNAIKHGRASRIHLSLFTDEGRCVLAIEDNGNGFGPAKSTVGMGLRIMHYRARMIGADLRVNQSPEEGVLIQCAFHSESLSLPVEKVATALPMPALTS